MGPLEAEYRDILAHLHLFCRGRRECPKCRGRGQRLDMTEDWGEPTYYHCTNCDGTGVVIERCGGWIVTDFDTVHECPLHYDGQPHPED